MIVYLLIKHSVTTDEVIAIFQEKDKADYYCELYSSQLEFKDYDFEVQKRLIS